MTSPADHIDRPPPDGAALLVVESLLRSAILSLERGDHETAERSLRQGLARVPEHPGCLATLALCLAEGQHRYVTAERLAARAVRVAPSDPWGYHALGRINLLGGRRQQAFRYLMRARSLAPADPRIIVDLQAMGRRRPPVLRTLRRDHPLNVALGRARHFLSTGTHVALVATLILVTLFSLVTAAYSASPPDAIAVERAGRLFTTELARIDSLLAAGSAEAAAVAARELLRREPRRPDLEWQARERLGVALTRCGRQAEAIAVLEAAIRDVPGVASLHLNLATALVAEGQRGRAFAEYEEAARLAPGNWRARLDYGQILARYGQHARARDALLDAQRLCGECLEADRALAMLALDQADYEAARPLLEGYVARSPGAGPERTALALARLRTGSAAGAIALLAPLWPDSLDARQLAILLEADRARGDATRAHELAGTTQGQVLHGAGVWGLVALICLENGLLDEALRASDLAIAEQPDNAAYWQNRAVVLERLGRAAEAEHDRVRALELDPSLADTSR